MHQYLLRVQMGQKLNAELQWSQGALYALRRLKQHVLHPKGDYQSYQTHSQLRLVI